MDARPELLPCRGHQAREHRAEGLRELHVRRDAAAEERRDPAAGPVDELIRDDDVERVDVLLERADRARGEDVLHAQHLETEDVGAEVELARKERVPGTVTGEKATRLPARVPTTYFPDGAPKGVSIATSSIPSRPSI